MADEGVLFSQVKKDVEDITRKCIEKNLHKRVFNQGDLSSWTSMIPEDVVNSLHDFNKNFKFSVVCTIM
jgi:hypothetical protein